MTTYDYVIVGSGLFGSIFAREMTDAGKTCLVLEERNHIGGNLYSEEIEGIHVSKYGGHIFHTNDEKIWNYVNRFSKFLDYRHRLRVHYKDNLYSFPINLMTLYQLWGCKTPEEANKKLEEVKVKIENPQNLEEWSLSQVGKEIYETFIKGYTQKQWNTDPKNLPASIIKRIPVRTTYDDFYFSDKYQGWPENGYAEFFDNLLSGIEVRTSTNFFDKRKEYESIGKKIVYTGKIDEYFGYVYGDLSYRSLRFDTVKLNTPSYLGSATVNFTDADVPYTRIIEHKYFQPHKLEKTNNTVITTEYPDDWERGKIPYYPVNDKLNNETYKKYEELSKKEKRVIFGGRLAEYRYYDMHQVVGSALMKSRKELLSKEEEVCQKF